MQISINITASAKTFGLKSFLHNTKLPENKKSPNNRAFIPKV